MALPNDVVLPYFCYFPHPNLYSHVDLNWEYGLNVTINFFLVEAVLILICFTALIAEAGSQMCMPAPRRGVNNRGGELPSH